MILKIWISILIEKKKNICTLKRPLRLKEPIKGNFVEKRVGKRNTLMY